MRAKKLKAPNTYRWQQERIKSRLDIIEKAINEIDDKNIVFQKVTYLARYIADIISEAENEPLNLAINKGLNVKVTGTRQCRASTLLKSKTYRYQLDLWMARSNQQKNIENTETVELRAKLLQLSNEHAITLDELRSQQEMHSKSQDGKALTTTERNDGMTIADMLIIHFREFCRIDNGALIEPSPLRPVIIPHNLFSAFLEWRSKVYQQLQ